MQRWFLSALCLLALPPAAHAEPVAFNRDIRPILSDRCFACHGPDGNHREAGLRLDQRASATGAVESGRIAIAAGRPEESELLKRVTSTDPDRRMPPGDNHKPLTPAEVDLLRRWIAEGATYQDHWSFTPITRPAVPAAVGTSTPTDHPVDRFLQARLQAAKLSPSAEADRRTLIRRVTLDLHGLPPTAAEIEAFVADRSPDAWEKVVDRLLASPRFAERQTMFWLDAVRYADSVGFHGDQFQDVWPYRNYVLKAFHSNMPFDQFTREQLAGDLLPNATRDQKVASAFNRLNRMSAEGGAQDKEYLAKYAADRVRTLGIAWLGLTTGCAECHDHKFDPFTMKDFYALEAFFADIEESGFYGGAGPTGEWGPILSLPTPEQEATLARIDAELKQIKALRDAIPEDVIAASRKAWEERLLVLDAAKSLNWVTVEPMQLATRNGAVLRHEGKGLIIAEGPNPDQEIYTVSFRPGAGEWNALRLQIESNIELPGAMSAAAGWGLSSVNWKSLWPTVPRPRRGRSRWVKPSALNRRRNATDFRPWPRLMATRKRAGATTGRLRRIDWRSVSDRRSSPPRTPSSRSASGMSPSFVERRWPLPAGHVAAGRSDRRRCRRPRCGDQRPAEAGR